MLSWFEIKFNFSHNIFVIKQISLKYGHLYYALATKKKKEKSINSILWKA